MDQTTQSTIKLRNKKYNGCSDHALTTDLILKLHYYCTNFKVACSENVFRQFTQTKLLREICLYFLTQTIARLTRRIVCTMHYFKYTCEPSELKELSK